MKSLSLPILAELVPYDIYLTQLGPDVSTDAEVAPSSLTTLTSCLFCTASEGNGFNIAYENDSFLAFEDISPASALHYLVVPRNHIENVRKLRSNDVELVKSMEMIGHKILDKFNIPIEQRRMGFHIPPFYSVDHLHLHVQGLPYISRLKAVKYFLPPRFGNYSKGPSWFVEVGQTIQILERGGQVGLLPC